MVHSKFDEILDRIKKSTGVRTQVELAAILGIRQSSISDAKRRDSVPADWYLKLFRTHGLNPDWLAEGQEPKYLKDGMAEATRLAVGVAEPAAAYGRSSSRSKLVPVTSQAGKMVDGNWQPDVICQLSVPETFFRPGIIIVQLDSSSMEPQIRRGAYLGLDTEQKRILSGEIYGVSLPHEGLVLKRVFFDAEHDRLVLKSDHSNHPDQYLSADRREDGIVGRAIWVIQDL